MLLHPPTDFSRVFSIAKRKIGQILLSAEIHHIGSTAVPGLGGKGIIDVLVAVPNWKNKASAVKSLKNLGYTHIHKEENERIFLSRVGQTQAGDIHIHLTHTNSAEYHNLLSFLNLLLTNPAIAKEYGSRKEVWLKQAKGDRKIYGQLKSVWINKMLEQITVSSKTNPNNPTPGVE